METKKLLRLARFNVKNIETNDVYITELLKSCDILALQEHWLFTFQLPCIEKTFQTLYASKDVDDPLPPIQKPRSYGGVTTLYDKDLNFKKSYLLRVAESL